MPSTLACLNLHYICCLVCFLLEPNTNLEVFAMTLADLGWIVYDHSDAASVAYVLRTVCLVDVIQVRWPNHN